MYLKIIVAIYQLEATSGVFGVMQITHLMTRKLVENDQMIHRYYFHAQVSRSTAERTLLIDLLDETGRAIARRKIQLPAIGHTQGHFINLDDAVTQLATLYRYKVVESIYKQSKETVSHMAGKYEDLTGSD